MMGRELADAGAFEVDVDPQEMKALNLCLAPGAYTAAILEAYPTASLSGITLPVASAGHKMMIPHGAEDTRVDARFMDITMLLREFSDGNMTVPSDHPDAMNFIQQSPFTGVEFDLVLRDAQILRIHERAGKRDDIEPVRFPRRSLSSA